MSDHDEIVKELLSLTSPAGTRSVEAQPMLKVAQEILGPELPWEAILEEIDQAVQADRIRLYKENFSVDELQQMLAFYSSPVGAKMVQLFPEILKALEASAMGHSERIVNRYLLAGLN